MWVAVAEMITAKPFCPRDVKCLSRAAGSSLLPCPLFGCSSGLHRGAWPSSALCGILGDPILRRL